MWSYIFLGILQGIFEWIPISSEGVVALASKFFLKITEPVDLALFLHLGTLFAVLWYFRKDWENVLTLKDVKLIRFLIIATVISLIIGYPLYKMVKGMPVGNSLLIVMGFGLLGTAYFHKTKRISEINFNKLAIITGLLQGLSVIPGLSRSGATVFGLSLGRLTPQETLKISYMMSAPVVLALSFYLFLTNPTIIFETWPSLIFSFLVGILTLHFLMKISEKINFFKFALFFSLLCFLGAVIGFLLAMKF